MKKLICLVLVIVILGSACSSKVEVNEPSAQPSESPANSLFDIPDLDNSITILLTNTLFNTNDVVMAEYMSELLAEAGFNVDIKFYDIDYQDYENSIIECENLIREEIEKGKNLLIENRVGISNLIADGLIYFNGDGEDDYRIDIGKRKMYSYTGIYIDKELEAKFGKPIESTQDYGDFLKWVADSDVDKTPGLMVMGGASGEIYNPMALFAQENGYVRADRAVGSISEGGTTLYMALEEIENAAIRTPGVHHGVELSFFLEMDMALSEWNSRGYLKFKQFEDLTKLSNYASIVMNTRDTTEYYSYNYQESHWKLIDVSDFNLHIITENGTYPDTPMLSDFGYSASFVISAKSPSPNAIIDFLDWIYSSTSNYLLFMCGKEGTDYFVKDDEISFVVNSMNINYGLWHKHTSFIEPSMDLVMPHFAANWKDVQSVLEDVKGAGIIRTIGYENIDIDISKIVDETVFDENLRYAYQSGVLPKYDKYFKEFSKDERKYLAEDLINDIESSEAAIKKKEAYIELLEAICGK